MAADRSDDGHARGMEGVAEVGRRADPVAQVVLVDDLAEPLGDRLEVAPGQPAVGREALGQDEQVAATLGQPVVVHRQPAADVGEAVLLRAHRHPVGQAGHLPDDLGDRSTRLARLALADEPGVLGEPAGVEEEGQTEPVADGADAAQVLQRDRLAAAGVVGHGHEDDGHVLGAARLDERGQCGEVHVALEGVLQGRLATLRDDQVDRLGAGELDVGPGRVEMGVVGDRQARATDRREEDLLGRPALVGGDDVAEREERLDRLEEDEPRRRAGVGLVAMLDAGPLVAGHRARARSRSAGR